jgi:nitric oxide reductase subunit B
MNREVFKSSERMILTVMASALVCMLISIAMGAVGVLSYLPEMGHVMADAGISLVQLRPLHTTFASAWLYLGCVACIYAYLFHRYGEPTEVERRRFRIHMVCWGIAGLGSLITLLFGIGSGREYLGFHPIFALFIIAGWVCFLLTLLGRVRHDFWSQPVYVYMWATGAVFFLYTFIEGHAHYLPFVKSHPVADLQIQWKSCGTLVASFNQMVYGCMIYIGERLTGDKRVAQSRQAFALLGLGLLNSFTNYAHHTYHLPQAHIIKWVAFTVSMAEILIVWNMLRELMAKLEHPGGKQPSNSTTQRFFGFAKSWNMILLPIALLISIPPLNALIHGTHVVMAHAMGSELAIDTYILLGAFTWLFAQLFPKRECIEAIVDGPAMRRRLTLLNLGLVGLVSWLLFGGLTVAISRYRGLPSPEYLTAFAPLMAVFGLIVGYSLVRITLSWIPLFRDPCRHKLMQHDPRWASVVGSE